MRNIAKITKSLIIRSILLTFLATIIVSCKKTSHRSENKNTREPQSKEEKKPAENKKATTVISTARSYIGTKYKFGGCSRNGIDCSGLVYTSFKSVNIELPRTSSSQSTAGKSVKIEDLKPGDLVFFTDKKGNSKVTHVGIVTEVKGNKNIKFIHASTKLGVVEDNLFADYYISIFLKAVRVL